MNKLWITVLILLLSSSTQAQRSKGDAACKAFKSQALKDDKAKELKYYVFGFAPPRQDFIETMRSKYRIFVISPGCVMDEETLCYNQVADSIIKARHGAKILKQVRAGSFK